MKKFIPQNTLQGIKWRYKIMNLQKWFDINQIIIFIGLTIIGTIGRYLLVGQGIQPFPNFEIIMVLTLLSIILLRSPIAFFVPMLCMIFSDLLIGNPIFIGNKMNQIVLFTYSGFALIALMSTLKKDQLKMAIGKLHIKNIGFAAGLGIGFVLIYDIWTNIGWWYLMYPHTLSSLTTVFTAGIPFMLYHMLSGALTFIAIALPITIWTNNKHYFNIPVKLELIHKLPLIAITILLICLSFISLTI